MPAPFTAASTSSLTLLGPPSTGAVLSFAPFVVSGGAIDTPPPIVIRTGRGGLRRRVRRRRDRVRTARRLVGVVGPCVERDHEDHHDDHHDHEDRKFLEIAHHALLTCRRRSPRSDSPDPTRGRTLAAPVDATVGRPRQSVGRSPAKAIPKSQPVGLDAAMAPHWQRRWGGVDRRDREAISARARRPRRPPGPTPPPTPSNRSPAAGPEGPAPTTAPVVRVAFACYGSAWTPPRSTSCRAPARGVPLNRTILRIALVGLVTPLPAVGVLRRGPSRSEVGSAGTRTGTDTGADARAVADARASSDAGPGADAPGSDARTGPDARAGSHPCARDAGGHRPGALRHGLRRSLERQAQDGHRGSRHHEDRREAPRPPPPARL